MSKSAYQVRLYSGMSGYSGIGGGGGGGGGDFSPTAYGMAYRSDAFNLTDTNWTDIPLNAGNANLFNVSHSTITNPERVTVGQSGIYQISYKVHNIMGAGAHHIVARIYKNNTSEILGSYCQETLLSDVNAVHPTHGTVIADLNSGDYITLQVATNYDISNEVDYYRTNPPPSPTTGISAIVVVSKIASAPTLARNYIDGLILSNNGSDANNDIDITAGAAKDSSNSFDLNLGATLTKRLDASWAVGSGNGGLDTGSKAVSTWYHLYSISNGSTVDALFSTNATSPTMPGGYSYKRRIGSVKTDVSGNILGFKQKGDFFWWAVQANDFGGVPSTGSDQLMTLSTPLGIETTAILTWCPYSLSNPVLISVVPTYFSTQDATDVKYRVIQSNTGDAVISELHIMTDTSSQIKYKIPNSYGPSDMNVNCRGYIDVRGKE